MRRERPEAMLSTVRLHDIPDRVLWLEDGRITSAEAAAAR
jgi:hypothetical protein